jgi:hypothetical protein
LLTYNAGSCLENYGTLSLTNYVHLARCENTLGSSELPVMDSLLRRHALTSRVHLPQQYAVYDVLRARTGSVHDRREQSSNLYETTFMRLFTILARSC